MKEDRCFSLQYVMADHDLKLYVIYKAYKTCVQVKAKSLHTNDIQHFYSVVSTIVHLKQQDMDMFEFLGRLESLKKEFNSLLPVGNTAEK